MEASLKVKVAELFPLKSFYGDLWKWKLSGRNQSGKQSDSDSIMAGVKEAFAKYVKDDEKDSMNVSSFPWNFSM